MYIFFCQKEDGIRYYKVTGVQTCALPIWPGTLSKAAFSTVKPGRSVLPQIRALSGVRSGSGQRPRATRVRSFSSARSEERRGGEEGGRPAVGGAQQGQAEERQKAARVSGA